MPFTDKQIKDLKPKKARYEKVEPGRTGLRIRVTPRGVKTWGYLYHFDGKQRRVVFGTYPMIGVAKAHMALADAREKLRNGIDPGAVVAEERRAERDAETVAELASEYLEHHARKRKKASSADADERLLNVEILPRWKNRKAKDITRRDVIKLLDGIEARGVPVMRNRTASLLSRLFGVGLDRGIVEAHPAAGIRRLEETPRDRILSPEEIHALWNNLDEIGAIPAVRLAIKFALATGQRRGEVAGAARSEIDDAEMLWRLPGERTKNGRENIIPLPPFIMALVKEADKHRDRPTPARPNRQHADGSVYFSEPSPFLFPSRVYGKPIEAAALTRALNRNRGKLRIGDATIHDLRRSFATAHGSIGTPPEILAGLLNHAPVTVTARVYNLASNIEPKRRAMERWCEWLQLVIAGEFEAARAMQGAEVTKLTDAA